MALQTSKLGNRLIFQIIDDSEKVIQKFNLDFEQGSESSEIQFHQGAIPMFLTEGWKLWPLKIESIEVLFPKPGNYTLQLLSPEPPQKIGTFAVLPATPTPLTSERITAIKSDPNAMKTIQVQMGCKMCSSESRSYAALEKKPELELAGWIWYKNLPSHFSCECGDSIIDLQYIRQNLYGFLGQPTVQDFPISLTRMYEKSSLRETRRKFEQLLRTNPPEETLQLFINENPILLHQFPANNIFSKPPILTDYIADFAILSPQRELILIEIEKGTTPLSTKKGDPAAALNHALQQVRNWLVSFDTHKLAALGGMSIDPDQVSLIRGVVIAGREEGYDAKHLRILKAADWGRVTLLTYDDLLCALDALIEKFEQL